MKFFNIQDMLNIYADLFLIADLCEPLEAFFVSSYGVV